MTERITETDVYQFLEEEWNEISVWMLKVIEGRAMQCPESTMKAKRKRLRIIEHITRQRFGF